MLSTLGKVMTSRHFLKCAAACAGTLTLASCGGGGGTGGGGSGGGGSGGGSLPPPFVYVMNAGPSTISAYSMNSSTGVLRPVGGSPFDAPSGSYSIAIDQNAHVLYATNTFVNSLSPLNIRAAGGALAEPSGQYFVGGTPLSVAVDPQGRFVYTANEGSDSISAFAIGADGLLAEVAGSPFLTGRLPNFVVIDAAGAHLYSANSGDNTVSAFAIEAASGALSTIAGNPIAISGQGPATLAIHPGGHFMYVGHRSTADLDVLSVDPSTGELAVLGSTVASGAINAIGIVPNGHYLYVTTGFAVEGFAIDDATGAPQPIPNGTFATDARPQALAIDPSGEFAYAPDNLSNAVIALSISASDGALAPVPGSPFPLDPSYALGLGPTSIAVAR